MKKFSSPLLALSLVAGFAFQNVAKASTPTNSQCVPQHASTDGTPYVIADNITLIVALEDIILVGTSHFERAVSRHESMTYDQVVADNIDTLNMKGDGVLEGMTRIYDTKYLYTQALQNYTLDQILAQEQVQLQYTLNPLPITTADEWTAQLLQAAGCNDNDAVANLMGFRIAMPNVFTPFPF